MNNVPSLERDYTTPQVQEPKSNSNNAARKEQLLTMLRKCLEENTLLSKTDATPSSPTPSWLHNLQTQVLREVDASSPHFISVAAQQTSSEIDDQVPESPSTPTSSSSQLTSNLKQPGSASKKKKVRFALPAIENPVQIVAELSLLDKLKSTSSNLGSRVVSAIRRLFFNSEQEADIENQLMATPAKQQNPMPSTSTALVLSDRKGTETLSSTVSTVQKVAKGGSSILREWMKRLIKLLNVFEMLLFTFNRMRMYEWANFVLQLRGMVYNSFQLVWGLLYLVDESSNQTIPASLPPTATPYSSPYAYSQPPSYPYNNAGAYPQSSYFPPSR